MTILRFFFLTAFFLAAQSGVPTAVGQSSVPIRPNGKVQHNYAEESEKTAPSLLKKLQNKFKPSQWFHKTESESLTEQDSRETEAPPWDDAAAVPVRSVPATLTHQKTETHSVPPLESGDLLEAPLPPQNSYLDSIARSKTPQNPFPILNDEPERGSQDFIQHDPFGTSVPEEQQTGLPSYSFDSRDWVESFPTEHIAQAEPPVQSPFAVETAAQDSEPDSFSSEQVTVIVPNVDEKLPDTADEWGGRTVDPFVDSSYEDSSPASPKPFLQNPFPESAAPDNAVQEYEPKVASSFNTTVSDANVEVENEEPVEASPPDFDLTPSYSKHLPYSEICGVVVVQANFPLTEIAPILEEIRLLQRDLNLYIGVPAAKEKIELCLFRDEKSYIQFLAAVFPKAPRDRRALYVKLDQKPGTLLIQKSEDFEIDLRHEMTHAIIHTSIRYVPIWLDEGLAKYFEVPIQDRAMNNPYMKTVRWNTRFGAVPSLARLEKLQDITQMSNREYRDSWAWVHFLIHHSPQTHHLLAGYLQLLSVLSDPQYKSAHKTQQIPPLELYLKDTVQNSREQYREHFRDE